MRKNIFKTMIAGLTALVCVLTCGVVPTPSVFASAEEGVYTQNFTNVEEVNRDFTAYYQSAMGAASIMMDVGASASDPTNWYIHNGELIRKQLEDDVKQEYDTASIAMLTFTKRSYVNFELTVEYKRSSDTFYWPVVAFRQSEPGQYYLEDGVGIFVQRDGKTTMWGGEGVGGPYESSSRGGYVDGQWHTLRIRVDGLSVSVYVDTDTTPALSRNLPTNMFRHGYITLTSVNNECAFRNFSVRELPVSDINEDNKQNPLPEANTSDALGNLADNVDIIDELNGLTQKGDSSSTQPQGSSSAPVENNGGCGSVLTVNSGLWILVACATIMVKKRTKKD